MSSTSDNVKKEETAPAEESTYQSAPREAEVEVGNKSEEVASEKEGATTSETNSRPTSSQSASKDDFRDDDDLTKRPTSGKKDESPERRRPKSSCSGEVVFTAKRKRKSKGPLPLDAHNVTFTVTIALAIPSGSSDSESDSETLSRMSHRESVLSAAELSSRSVHSVTKSALHGEEDATVPDLRDLMKRKKRVFEAPRAQNYYHLEYYLLPDDEEPIKTDVVTYGIAAKIYMERHDPRVLKTWQDGDVTWVAWTHSHSVTVTKDVLLQLFGHKLELRIWDSKDRCSTRARFDRPKAFRIPQPKPGEDPEELGGVKSQVIKQSRSYINMQPKKSCTVRPLPSQISVPKEGSSRGRRQREEQDDAQIDATPVDKKAIPQGDEAPKTDDDTPDTLVAVKRGDTDGAGNDTRTFSRLGRLAGLESPTKISRNEDPQSEQSSRARTHGASARNENGSPRSQKGSPRQPVSKSPMDSDYSTEKQQADTKGTNRSPALRKKAKTDAASQAEVERVKKYGICSVPVRMNILFAGAKSLTCRLDSAVAGVEDAFVSVAIDGPLMSEGQKKELNPLILKIHSATNMPETPMGYEELRERCNPIYCKYQFHKQPEHKSIGKEHSKNVYWDDIGVCLTGVLEPSEFRQFLNGPPLEIELHDRDRKQASIKVKPTLFGDDLEDEKINNVGTVTSRRTLHNAFQGRDKPWDPYGVAKVDLSELLLGNKFLYLKVPVHTCKYPDILGLTNAPGGRLVGIPGAVDGPVSHPLPAGHYVESNTMLKVTVELAFPLASPEDIAAKRPVQSTFECPFGRLVFKFDYNNTDILHRLLSVVSAINARALDLDDMPQHVIDAALSTYKLSKEQQKSRDLDIVTGFHVMDGVNHIFVLEGLRDKGITTVWESLPQPENEDVTVLYNSDFTFSERLYGALDVDLCRIKLHEPLHTIVEQPLLYVRDMVPKPCFLALVKLEELLKVERIKDAVRSDLFPSADMVISMSKEFGVPLTVKDFQALHLVSDTGVTEDQTCPVTMVGPAPCLTSRDWTPIDNFNQSYVDKVMDRHVTGSMHNFVQENIDEIRRASDFNRRSKTMVEKVRCDMTVAHNYSTQSLNSTEIAKEKLRLQLAQKPDTRYTYCPEFHHSMTIVPVNIAALKKQEEEISKSRWKTEEGWVYPGVQPTVECNRHPNNPDPARLDELKEDWQENILHSNVLEPTLDRGRFPWQHRSQDLELYRKPLPNFGMKDPLTIHYSGEKLAQERRAAKMAELELWRSRVIVSNPRQNFHRCLTETELLERGYRSSNNLDKLKGLLKDSPSKMTLRKQGFVLQDIPPLGVVNYPSVDTAARKSGGSVDPAVPDEDQQKTNGFNPGPYTNLRWVREENKIPIYDYNHQHFQRTKTQDFRLVHKNHSFQCKRQIPKLTNEETAELYGYNEGMNSLDWKNVPLPPIEDNLCTAAPSLVQEHKAVEALVN